MRGYIISIVGFSGGDERSIKRRAEATDIILRFLEMKNLNKRNKRFCCNVTIFSHYRAFLPIIKGDFSIKICLLYIETFLARKRSREILSASVKLSRPIIFRDETFAAFASRNNRVMRESHGFNACGWTASYRFCGCRFFSGHVPRAPLKTRSCWKSAVI